MELTADSSADVRDWAVFGLGVQGDVDSPEIRDVLVRCLGDSDENVREEAAVGLGKRRDPRVLPALQKMLEDPDFSQRVAEAAAYLLGMEKSPKDWSAAEFLEALKKFAPLP
jgi:HEAT repeat protein